MGAVPHRLEEENSASEDAGSKGGVDCDVSHWLGRRTNHQPTSFKASRESPKRTISTSGGSGSLQAESGRSLTARMGTYPSYSKHTTMNKSLKVG